MLDLKTSDNYEGLMGLGTNIVRLPAGRGPLSSACGTFNVMNLFAARSVSGSIMGFQKVGFSKDSKKILDKFRFL